MNKRLLALYVRSTHDRTLMERIQTHLAIMKAKGVFVKYVDLAENLLTTDDLNGYSAVLVFITPVFLASYELWKNLEGYLGNNVTAVTIPIYLRTCDYSASIFQKKILPGTKAFSEMGDKDSAAMEIAKSIDSAISEKPVPRVLTQADVVPDVAVFCDREDVELMKGFDAFMKNLFPGLNIWRSWDITAGSTRAREYQRAEQAPIQIIGLSAKFLAEHYELLARAKGRHRGHDCRLFCIRLRPAPYNLAFESYELERLLPSSGGTIVESSPRAFGWQIVTDDIAANLLEKRMTSGELVQAYWNK